LMSDYVTPWDSTQDLRVYDGGNTGVQVIGGVMTDSFSIIEYLMGNNADFSEYDPTPNPDYSTSNGNTLLSGIYRC